MIPLDSDDGNTGALHHRESLDGVIHCLGRDCFLVEKVTAHDHEVDVFFNAVSSQHVHPRVKKIAWALRELVPCATQVHVGNVQELHSVKLYRTGI